VFDSVEVAFLQRLFADRPVRRKASAVATRFAREHGLGVLERQQVTYAEEDHVRAGHLLTNHGYAHEGPPEGARRSDAAGYGAASEKAGTLGPYSGAVLVKPFHGVFEVDGQVLPQLSGACSMMDVETARRCEPDVWLYVENLETMRRIERYRWIPDEGLRVLALYRGDPVFSPAAALAAIDGHSKAWCFADFDPAGLLIADSLDRRGCLDRLIVPSLVWVQARMAPGGDGKPNLFHGQVDSARGRLDGHRRGDIAGCWNLLGQCKKGLPQELMVSAPCDEKRWAIGKV